MQKNYARLNTELEQSNADGNYDYDFQERQSRTNLFKSNLERSNFEGPSEIDFYEQNSRVNLLRSNLEQTNLDDPIELNFYEQNSRTDLFAHNPGESEHSKTESSLEPFPDIDFNRQESVEQESTYIKYESQLENSLLPNAVSPDELDAMFKDMKKYQPKDIKLETKLKAFIPDYIPCILSPEKFLRPSRPDGKPETIGVDKLIEPFSKRPSSKHSDLWSYNHRQAPSKKDETKAEDKISVLPEVDVGQEIKEIYKYIASFKPKDCELNTILKPFIPDYIPATGDPDGFLELPRPDLETDLFNLSVITRKRRLQINS